MKNPFRKGDVVYSKNHGRLEVESAHSATYINTKENTSWKKLTLHIRDISFDPWPEPNHVRPFTPGWYTFRAYGTLAGDTLYAKEFTEKPGSDISLVHFLGEKEPPVVSPPTNGEPNAPEKAD